MLLASTDTVSGGAPDFRSPVKTVFYRKRSANGASGRVSIRTFKELITRWEIGPDDTIRVDGDSTERRVREYPAISPLDEMLRDASDKVNGSAGQAQTITTRYESLMFIAIDATQWVCIG